MRSGTRTHKRQSFRSTTPVIIHIVVLVPTKWKNAQFPVDDSSSPQPWNPCKGCCTDDKVQDICRGSILELVELVVKERISLRNDNVQRDLTCCLTGLVGYLPNAAIRLAEERVAFSEFCMPVMRCRSKSK